jgi:NADH:ubiquinone oxidoreductase subunit E
MTKKSKKLKRSKSKKSTVRKKVKKSKPKKKLGKKVPLKVVKDDFCIVCRRTTENVINKLQKIQEEKGFLPNEDMINVSKKEGIPGVYVYGVATFYSQFKFNKPGKHQISVCRGTACHVKNSLEILNYLQDILNINPGETTEDGRISLECVNCIGACAMAPAMMIDGKVYGELTKDKVKKIINELQ